MDNITKWDYIFESIKQEQWSRLIADYIKSLTDLSARKKTLIEKKQIWIRFFDNYIGDYINVGIQRDMEGKRWHPFIDIRNDRVLAPYYIYPGILTLPGKITASPLLNEDDNVFWGYEVFWETKTGILSWYIKLKNQNPEFSFVTELSRPIYPDEKRIENFIFTALGPQIQGENIPQPNILGGLEIYPKPDEWFEVDCGHKEYYACYHIFNDSKKEVYIKPAFHNTIKITIDKTKPVIYIFTCGKVHYYHPQPPYPYYETEREKLLLLIESLDKALNEKNENKTTSSPVPEQKVLEDGGENENCD